MTASSRVDARAVVLHVGLGVALCLPAIMVFVLHIGDWL